MKNKVAAGLLFAVCLIFAILVASSAIGFITSDELLAQIIGWVVLIVLAFILWSLLKELRFGMESEKLANILEEEGKLPEDNLPRGKYGQIDRDAADAEFEVFRAETEAAPQDWRSWYRLGLAYDAAGDRKRARESIRKAIALHTMNS